MHRRLAAFLTILLLAACSAVEPGDPRPGDGGAVRLERDSIGIALDQGVRLSAVRLDASGQPVPGSMSWQTGDPRIATVDSSGNITATGIGRTWVAASDSRHSDTAIVTTYVRYLAVQAGWNVTCGLTVGGRIMCWGWNEYGSLGGGDAEFHSSPMPIAGTARFGALSLGAASVCGLGDGLWCWGYNGVGQLGDGSITSRAEPVRVAAGLRLGAITLGAGTTACAISPNDAVGASVFCWGWNRYNQLLDGRVLNAHRPTGVDAGFPLAAVATGGNHMCALDLTGLAWCWGRNSEGQLGDGTTSDRAGPTPVGGGRSYTALVAGAFHTCGLSAGQAWCWGDNVRGQLGGVLAPFASDPRPVAAGRVFESIASSAWHTCGISGGTALCWGMNRSGQLGNGSATSVGSPMPVTGGLIFRTISAGLDHSCGITVDQLLYCWGGNTHGELGDGTQISRTAPVLVVGQ